MIEEETKFLFFSRFLEYQRQIFNFCLIGSSSAFFHCAVCELEIRSDIKYVCLDCPAEFCYPCHAHISRDLTLHLHEPAHGGTNLPLPRLVRLESNENADFNHSDFHSSTIDVLKVDIYRFWYILFLRKINCCNSRWRQILEEFKKTSA